MRTFFKQYAFLMDRQAKKQLPALLLIFFSSSLLDVVGLGLIGAFLLLIVNFSNVIHKLPLAIQKQTNHFSEHTVIVFVGIGLVIAFIFKAVWGIYSQRKIVNFTSQFATRSKIQLISGYQTARYSFHLQQNSALLMNKISLIDGFTNNVLSVTLTMLSSFLVVFSIIACLVIIHPVVTLLLTMMTVLIFFSYEFFVKNKVIQIGKKLTVTGGEINKSVLQTIGGLKEIRVFGKEEFFLNKIKNIVSGYSQALSAYNALQLIPRYAVESSASIFLVILVLGAMLVGVSPINMIPTLGVFAAACIRLLPVISQLIGQFGQLRSIGYSTSGLLYDEINTLQNLNESHLNITHDGSCQPFTQFSFQHISFRYDHAKQNALDNVSLSISKGQSVGFIGKSGAGKSTLMSIVLGLLKPDSGELLVDGIPVHHSRAWLNNFAYIPQSIFLLDDTLKRNIAMGTADHDINEQKLHNALVMAQLLDVVANLPNGVDTIIGENGIRLSGGQRQRVALARAFYYEREIIVMDEATSALDNETEREIISAIKQLHGIKTLIVIAHRLSTIEYCDFIYKLENGRMIDQGSYEEVVNKNRLSTVN